MIDVVAAADDAYARPLAGMARSMFDHVADAGSVRFHVLDAGISPHNRILVQQSIPETEILWHSTSLAEYDSFPQWAYISRASYLRLSIPDVIESDRVIYLDCDLLIRKDIKQLWDIPLHGAAAGAVLDMDCPKVSREYNDRMHRLFGAATGQSNFNAGVLSLDLVQWRAEELSSRVKGVIERFKSTIGMDQDAINLALAGRIQRFPDEWNVQPELFGDRVRHLSKEECAILHTDPAIVHFASPEKPWQSGSKHPRTQDFRDVLRNTAYSDQPLDQPWKPPTRDRIRWAVRRRLSSLRRRVRR